MEMLMEYSKNMVLLHLSHLELARYFALFCFLSANAIQALLAMVLEVPDAYLQEYATSILERYKLKLSANIIGKFLRAKSITRKKVYS
jgi:hypothetical protein